MTVMLLLNKIIIMFIALIVMLVDSILSKKTFCIEKKFTFSKWIGS